MLELAQLFGVSAASGDGPEKSNGEVISAEAENVNFCTGYTIRRGRSIDVQIEDGTEPRMGKVLDISPTGVKLLTISSKLVVGDKAKLTIAIPEQYIEVSRDAYVSWIGRRGESAWHTGFALSEPLEQGLFERLVDSRYLERRQGMRYPVSTSASMDVADSDRQFDVLIKDFSSTGCRIAAPESIDVETRAILTIYSKDKASVSVPAEVRWVEKSENGYAIGLRFLEPTDLDVFQSARDNLADDTDANHDEETIVWNWVTILAVLAGMTLGICLLLF